MLLPAKQTAPVALTPRCPHPYPPPRAGEGQGGSGSPGTPAWAARLPLLLLVLAAHGTGIAMLGQMKRPVPSVPPAPPIEVSLITLPVPLPVANPVVSDAPPPPAEPARVRREPPAARRKPAQDAIPRPEAISEPASPERTAASEDAQAAPAPRVATAAAAPTGAAAPITPARFDAAYLQNPPPPYPPLAKRMGEQGRVMLRVFVSAEGRADGIEVKASSGSPRLDQAALETVRTWRFVPARQGDKPVGAWVIVPISFNLEG